MQLWQEIWKKVQTQTFHRSNKRRIRRDKPVVQEVAKRRKFCQEQEARRERRDRAKRFDTSRDYQSRFYD